jgi:hypothetical protein
MTFDWFVLLTPVLLLVLLLPFLFIGCGLDAVGMAPPRLVLKLASNINSHHYGAEQPLTMVSAHFALKRLAGADVVFGATVMGGMPPAPVDINPAATIVRVVPAGSTANCYKVTCYCELRFGTQPPYETFTTAPPSEMPYHEGQNVYEFMLMETAPDKWEHDLPPFIVLAMTV